MFGCGRIIVFDGLDLRSALMVFIVIGPSIFVWFFELPTCYVAESGANLNPRDSIHLWLCQYRNRNRNIYLYIRGGGPVWAGPPGVSMGKYHFTVLSRLSPKPRVDAFSSGSGWKSILRVNEPRFRHWAIPNRIYFYIGFLDGVIVILHLKCTW